MNRFSAVLELLLTLISPNQTGDVNPILARIEPAQTYVFQYNLNKGDKYRMDTALYATTYIRTGIIPMKQHMKISAPSYFEVIDIDQDNNIVTSSKMGEVKYNIKMIGMDISNDSDESLLNAVELTLKKEMDKSLEPMKTLEIIQTIDRNGFVISYETKNAEFVSNELINFEEYLDSMQMYQLIFSSEYRYEGQTWELKNKNFPVGNEGRMNMEMHVNLNKIEDNLAYFNINFETGTIEGLKMIIMGQPYLFDMSGDGRMNMLLDINSGMPIEMKIRLTNKTKMTQDTEEKYPQTANYTVYEIMKIDVEKIE